MNSLYLMITVMIFKESVYVYRHEGGDGTMFKSEGLICTSAADLFEFLTEDFESQSLWNPMFGFSEVITSV